MATTSRLQPWWTLKSSSGAGTHKEDVSDEELRRRGEEWVRNMQKKSQAH